jgi:hypothetical protein
VKDNGLLGKEGKVTEYGLPAMIEEVRNGVRADVAVLGCGLGAVPESLRGLRGLRRLDLRGNRLSTVPAWLGELTGLQKLDLQGNRLTTLPESLGDLTGLTDLNLGFNRLAQLPDGVRGLARLQRLYLRGNRLTSLPEAIGELTGLVMLDLSDNKLSTLPGALGNLTGLEGLELAGNRLTTLPTPVLLLTGLRVLTLNRNRLTAISEAIGELTNLVMLDLSDNMFTALPKALDGLAKHARLVVAGNPMSPRVLGPPPARGPAIPGRSWRFEQVVQGLTSRYGHLGWKDANDSMFGDIGWLPSLTGDERTEAEDLAIATLLAGDPRAALALGDARCTRAIPALLDMATSRSITPYVRLLAVRGLIQLDQGAGRTVAIEILRDSAIYRHDRCEAIRVLAAHPDNETEMVLEEVTADADPEVRTTAAWALRDIREPRNPA